MLEKSKREVVKKKIASSDRGGREKWALDFVLRRPARKACALSSASQTLMHHKSLRNLVKMRILTR